jgi:hypothetical protein
MGDAERFVDEGVRIGIPGEIFTGVVCATGPFASFEMTETWVDNPYRHDLALIGDQAASNDSTVAAGAQPHAAGRACFGRKTDRISRLGWGGPSLRPRARPYLNSALKVHFGILFELGPDRTRGARER